MKNDQLLRDLGKAYAIQASDFLREKFGSQMELGELGIFYSSASAWMAARAFAVMFEKSGHEEAEKFLQQTLSNLGANIRLQKIPAMVKTTASVIPTQAKPSEPEQPSGAKESDAQPPPASAAAPATEIKPPSCSCKLEKGECKACPEKIAAAYRDFAGYLITYVKTVAEKTGAMLKDCPSCVIRYSDQALASIAKDGIPAFKGESPELQEQVFHALLQFASAIGVTEMPMTEKVVGAEQEG